MIELLSLIFFYNLSVLFALCVWSGLGYVFIHISTVSFASNQTIWGEVRNNHLRLFPKLHLGLNVFCLVFFFIYLNRVRLQFELENG